MDKSIGLQNGCLSGSCRITSTQRSITQRGRSIVLHARGHVYAIMAGDEQAALAIRLRGQTIYYVEIHVTAG